MFTFSGAALATKSFVLPLQKGFYPVRLEYFQKEGGSAINLVYLVPEAKPVNPIMVPFKLLYHK